MTVSWRCSSGVIGMASVLMSRGYAQGVSASGKGQIFLVRKICSLLPFRDRARGREMAT
jgi:hypothetical protein